MCKSRPMFRCVKPKTNRNLKTQRKWYRNNNVNEAHVKCRKAGSV